MCCGWGWFSVEHDVALTFAALQREDNYVLLSYVVYYASESSRQATYRQPCGHALHFAQRLCNGRVAVERGARCTIPFQRPILIVAVRRLFHPPNTHKRRPTADKQMRSLAWQVSIPVRYLFLSASDNQCGRCGLQFGGKSYALGCDERKRVCAHALLGALA